MAARSFHAQKNHAEMYVRDLIEEGEPSDLSSRTDALSTYEVDPLSSHRATKPASKNTKKKSNKTSNLCEREDSLASTSDEDEHQDEALNCDVHPGVPMDKRGASCRSRSRQFTNTWKRATQTDRHRIKLLSVVEEGHLVRKYEVTSAGDWLGYGPYSVSVGKIS